MRLKKLRLEKNLTQEELGNIINQTKSNISKYENEILEPNIETLQKISNYFKVSIDYLIEKSDIRNPYGEETYLPYEFKTPEEAIKFILEQPTLMDYGGYSLNDMTQEEVLDFTDDILIAIKIILEQKNRK